MREVETDVLLITHAQNPPTTNLRLPMQRHQTDVLRFICEVGYLTTGTTGIVGFLIFKR